jgi:hypothetical protein
MCGSFRTSRALTQLYEEALRPVGLRATQLTILQALSYAGEASPASARNRGPGRGGEQGALLPGCLSRTPPR